MLVNHTEILWINQLCSPATLSTYEDPQMVCTLRLPEYRGGGGICIKDLVLTLWQGLILCTAHLCYVWDLCTALCLVSEIDTSTNTVYLSLCKCAGRSCRCLSIFLDSLNLCYQHCLWVTHMVHGTGTATMSNGQALIHGCVFICANHFSTVLPLPTQHPIAKGNGTPLESRLQPSPYSRMQQMNGPNPPPSLQ